MVLKAVEAMAYTPYCSTDTLRVIIRLRMKSEAKPTVRTTGSADSWQGCAAAVAARLLLPVALWSRLCWLIEAAYRPELSRLFLWRCSLLDVLPSLYHPPRAALQRQIARLKMHQPRLAWYHFPASCFHCIVALKSLADSLKFELKEMACQPANAA